MESQDISRRVKAGIERFKKEKGYWGRPKVKVTPEEVRELREKGLAIERLQSS